MNFPINLSSKEESTSPMSKTKEMPADDKPDPVLCAKVLLPKWRQAIAEDDAANYETARDLYLELVGECPGVLSAYNNLAVLDIFNGNLARAEEYAKRATQCSYDSGLSTLGSVLVRQGRFAEAMVAYKYADRSNDTRTNLSGVYVQLGRYAEAISTAEEVLKKDPNIPQAYANIIIAYVKKGLPRKAEEISNVALQHASREAIRPDLRISRDSMLVVAYPENKILVHIDLHDSIFTKPIG